MKMRRSFFHAKDDLRIFHFERITKIAFFSAFCNFTA